MTEKTLKELRAQARALGISGYSRLTKAQLLKRLVDARRTPARPVKRGIKHAAPAAKKPKPRKPRQRDMPSAVPRDAKPTAKVQAAHHPEPATTLIAQRATTAGIEESIEAAKYAVTTAGMAPGGRRLADLLEDIERLPGARAPQLGLLPQKPGVLHAYWALPAGADVTRARLRLCRIEGNAVEVVEEVALPAMAGHWYFHVPEGGDAGAWCVHLGRYDERGNFVSGFERAIARLPTLYADGRPDRQWWIDEARFRAMYLRAGGVARGKRLGWPGSFSSR